MNLRAGDVVEVKSKEEILRSLDQNGDFGRLPFMPEMLQFCGRRFRVYKRAHKTCDTIHYRDMRRMENAVHLDDLRCDGSSHDGCQARCLLFWKDEWLRQVESRPNEEDSRRPTASGAPLDEEGLQRATQKSEGIFRCQATEMNRATVVLRKGDLKSVVEDVRSGNVPLRDVLRWALFDLFAFVLHRGRGYRAKLWIYNHIARWLGGSDYPEYQGNLGRTPYERLDLEAGELVRIKDRDAVVRTLDTKNKNRGLSFDIEMVNFCGKTARVLGRIDKIIDEKTGRMLNFPNSSIILEGVTCKAYYKNRGCPRSVYPHWRETWLERVE